MDGRGIDNCGKIRSKMGEDNRLGLVTKGSRRIKDDGQTVIAIFYYNSLV